MKFIILNFLIIFLIFPTRSFAALDYGKQSLVGADFSGSDLKGMKLVIMSQKVH